MNKFIFVVGGVYSGTGKGIAAASLGLLLKMRGIDVTLIKCDPYFNVNAGTMSPREHGEVFLCEDGSETDLDLGHYERIAGVTVSKINILTSGTLYKELLEKEENGGYLGQTISVIPHVTNKIQERLRAVSKGHDIVIAEIGGTVGDFESCAFYEAISQLKARNPDDVMVIMVAPVIYNNTIKEFKTKPLQNSVRSLRHDGLTPDIILCRCDREIPKEILDKVSRLTGVPKDAVFEAPDVETIYQVPLEFYNRNIDDLVVDRFHFPRRGVRIHKFRELVEKFTNGHDLPKLTIGIVGKYDNCDEAYISLKEALTHAAVANNVKCQIKWINAEDLESVGTPKGFNPHFDFVHGVIVPGGFDCRGVQGKIAAVKHCREANVPFLGICLGLQCAVIEYANNVLGLKGANSQEFDKNTPHPVIHYVAGQHDGLKKSGTMRLGSYDCELEKDSLVRDLYKRKLISERHRHRYEVNDEYIDQNQNFRVSGRNPESGLIEMMELKKELHPFFVGTQAHPEFKSRLGDPAPLFDGLIKAARVFQLGAQGQHG